MKCKENLSLKQRSSEGLVLKAMAAIEGEQKKKGALSFEEGWPVLQQGVDRLIAIIDGVDTNQFTSEDYMRLYTIAFEICHPDPTGPGSQKLYAQQKKTYEDFVTSKALPNLRDKKDEVLLQELVKRWGDHKVFTRWLSRFLHYLDRYFVPKSRLPSVQATSYLAFYNLVYGELNDRVRDAVLSMIDRERKGEQIDQALVKKVLDIYVEMGEDSKKYYEKDFEGALIKSTAEFYADRALTWITSESYKDYMLKVDRCLEQEKERISCYLQKTRQHKLLEALEHELLAAHEIKLEEMKQLESQVV